MKKSGGRDFRVQIKRGTRKNLFIIGGIVVAVLLVLGIYYFETRDELSLSPAQKLINGDSNSKIPDSKEGSPRGGEIPLTACGVLNQAGATYVLQNNVISHETKGAQGTCFTIAADDITLDGNGYEAEYGSVSYVCPDGRGMCREEGYLEENLDDFISGVYSAESRTGITIKNLKLKNYLSGIAFSNGLSNSQILNNEIDSSSSGSTISGAVYIGGASDGNIISGNTITTPNQAVVSGISLDSSSNDQVLSNTIIIHSSPSTKESGVGSGIEINRFATHSSFRENIIETYGHGSHGISVGLSPLVQESMDNTIESNTIKTYSDLADGIYAERLSTSQIKSNNIEVSGGETYGIFVSSPKTIYILENTIKNLADANNWGSGIGINYPTGQGNLISGNDIKLDGRGYGIDGLGFGVDSTYPLIFVFIRENKIDSANLLGSSSIHIVSEDETRTNSGVYYLYNNILTDNGQLQLDASMKGARNKIYVGVNQQIRKYSIHADSFGFVDGPDNGDDFIGFTQSINSAGNNLDDVAQLRNNYANIKSEVYPEFNKPANINFRDLPLFSNPKVFRNGQLCSSSICAGLTYHLQHSPSELYGASFRVTGWSNYSIGEGPSCSDSDGGFDYTIKGIANFQNRDYTDYCTSAVNLVEYGCNNSGIESRTKDCRDYNTPGVNYYCLDGYCRIYPSCRETDGGYNLYQKGATNGNEDFCTISVNNPGDRVFECIPGEGHICWMHEGACENKIVIVGGFSFDTTVANYYTLQCPNNEICRDGACVPNGTPRSRGEGSVGGSNEEGTAQRSSDGALQRGEISSGEQIQQSSSKGFWSNLLDELLRFFGGK